MQQPTIRLRRFSICSQSEVHAIWLSVGLVVTTAMRCMFCLNERPPGNEHVFQRAIGGTLRTDRVCDEAPVGTRSCNSQLGSVADAPLTDHPFIAKHRERLGLAGYSGKIPNAAQSLLGKGGVLATDPTQKMQLVKNRATGQLDPKMLYNRKTEILADKTIKHQITIDARGGIEEVRRILASEIRRSKKDNPNITVPTDAELERIAQVCVNNAQRVEGPVVRYELPIEVTKYRRGIFKIAYELAFLWLGEKYLDDPVAAKLRAVIIEGADPQAVGIHGHIEFGCSIEPLRPWANEADTHVAFNAVVGRKIAICLKIFDEISAVIVVTDEPAKYCNDQFDQSVIRFISINAASGIERQSSYIDECGRIASEMLHAPRRTSGAGQV